MNALVVIGILLAIGIALALVGRLLHRSPTVVSYDDWSGYAEPYELARKAAATGLISDASDDLDREENLSRSHVCKRECRRCGELFVGCRVECEGCIPTLGNVDA